MVRSASTDDRAAHAGDEQRLPDARVRDLIAARRRRYLALSSLVCTVYAAVAIGFAFVPGVMARPAVGESISTGLVSIAVVMLVGIASAGYYTWWANTVHARLLEATLRAVAPAER